MLISIVSSAYCSNNNKMLYWLSNIDLEKINGTSFKYVIIDYSSDGSEENIFSKSEIENLKNSLPGKRIILCYLSIGEAEDYRFYWKENWKKPKKRSLWSKNPPFLGNENMEWPGNYLVDYRNTEWQEIIFSYIDIIISQGFDGIYLDRVDSYEDLQNKPYYILEARDKMENFVINISNYSKKKKKNFKIFVQNGEELVLKKNSKEINKAYLNSVDGIGREDTFYFKKRRSEKEIKDITDKLAIFKKNNKVVFTIDYPVLSNSKDVKWVKERAGKCGFIEYCAPLELDKIVQQ